MKYYEIYSRIGKETHIMIGGSTGCGKTVAEKGIIFNLARNYSPDEVEMWFIDPKATVLHRLLWLPHVRQYADNDQDALLLLDLLDKEMRDRNKWCQDRDIEEYPGKAIYCFIDETADIIVRQGKDALRKFQMLLQMARSANIHMVFCSQCFNRKLIPTEVQCNVTCVVGLKVRATDKILSKLMVGDNSCCNLPRYGKGVVITPDGITTEDIPMYTDEDWNELRKSTLLRRVI